MLGGSLQGRIGLTELLLEIREQLRFAEHILKLIIEGRYSPAAQDHINFLLGGDARKKVVSMAADDGGFELASIVDAEPFGA